MPQRSPAHGNSRRRLGRAERRVALKRGHNITGDFDRKCFEFDRKIVVGLLDTLRRAINEGATHIDMVAAERRFDESLLGTFSLTAQHLHRMVSKLEKLLGDVAEATGYPKMVTDCPVGSAVVRRLPNQT
jgi:hypothetical protein